MPTRPTTRSTILGIAFAALVTSCAMTTRSSYPPDHDGSTHHHDDHHDNHLDLDHDHGSTGHDDHDRSCAHRRLRVGRTLRRRPDAPGAPRRRADGVYGQSPGPLTRPHSTTSDCRPTTCRSDRSPGQSLDRSTASPPRFWNRSRISGPRRSGTGRSPSPSASRGSSRRRQPDLVSAWTVPAPRPLATRPRHRPDRVGLALHRRRREALRRCRSRDLRSRRHLDHRQRHRRSRDLGAVRLVPVERVPTLLGGIMNAGDLRFFCACLVMVIVARIMTQL